MDRAERLKTMEAMWGRLIPAGEIAREIGRSIRTVNRTAARLGLPKRKVPRGRRIEEEDRFKTLWGRETGVDDIAKEMSCSRTQVYRTAYGLGLPRRNLPRGRSKGLWTGDRLERLKIAYEGSVKLLMLGMDHGISPGHIVELAKKHGWARRRPR